MNTPQLSPKATSSEPYRVGTIYTNLTTEELSACMPSGEVNITHSGYHRVSLVKSEDQSIASDTWVNVGFDTEEFKVGNIHSNTVNNERVTIEKDGCYMIYFAGNFENSDNNLFSAKILKNTDESMAVMKAITPEALATVTPKNVALINLEKDDYICLQVKHDCTESKSLYADGTYFIVTRIF